MSAPTLAAPRAGRACGHGGGPLLRLSLSMLILRLAGSLQMVALPLFVVARYGLGVSAGVTLALKVLPNIVFGVLLGQVIDRYDPRRLAAAGAVASALVALVIPASGALWQVRALVFAAGVIQMFDRPAHMALRPLVMPPGHECRVNGFMVGADKLSGVVGPLAAGLLVSLSGVTSLFVAEAGVCLLGGVLLLTLPQGSVEVPRRDRTLRSLGRSVGEVFSLLGRDKVAGILTLSAATCMVAFGSRMLLLSYVIKHSLQGAPSGTLGYLLAAMGAGGLVGALCAVLLARRRQGLVYLVATLLQGVCWVAVPHGISLPWEIALLFFVGCFETLGTVVFFTETQRRVPRGRDGSFYGTLFPLLDVFVAIGSLAVVPSLAAYGADTTAALMGLAVVLPVLYFARSLAAAPEEMRRA